MTRNEQHDDLAGLDEVLHTMKAEEPPRDAYEAAQQRLLRKIESTSNKESLMSTLTGTTSRARFGRLAFAAAVAVAAAFFVLRPLGTDPVSVYASVVQQLRDAVTVAFSAEWYFDHGKPTHIEAAFREPGLQRMAMTYDGADIVQINDTVSNEGLILIPAARMYAKMDLASMPSVERDRLGLIRMMTEELRNLPTEADQLEVVVVDGRRELGFTTGNRTLWIDEETRELVRVDNVMGGTRMVMTNFRLDPPELDASSFSTVPPAGYKPTLEGPIAYDVKDPGEEDLVDFLRFMATVRVDRRFPSTVNPLEILTLQEKGLMVMDEQASPVAQDGGAAFARASQLAVTFVTGMGPANHWRYVGDGVVLGTANTPIAWWKPDGSASYRVIWADLTVTDEADWDRRAAPPA